MRRDITFTSRGQRCVGWLYTPDDLSPEARVPAIVMANGLTSVKEIHVPRYAERFAEAGFAALLFDFRFLGESEGEPRSRIVAPEQQEDLRNAISWLSLQPEVDPSRIGAWGVSLGAAHVLYLSAFDRRIKSVVSTVPSLSTTELLLGFMGRDGLLGYLTYLSEDRTAHYREGGERYMAAVSSGGEPALMQNPEAYEFYTQASQTIGPNWRNQVTMESVENLVEYDPAWPIHLISPTPLLIILAEKDWQPAALTLAAYERAGDPKQIVTLACSHADVLYKEPWVTQSEDQAVDWFRKHLQPAPVAMPELVDRAA